MGGKSSKQQNLSRNNSIRKSQRKIFQKIQKKYNECQKEVQKFNGEPNSASHLKIKSAVTTIKFELEEIQSNLKEKHKQTHENWMKKVNELLNEIEEKTQTINKNESGKIDEDSGNDNGNNSGKTNVELKLVKLAAEKRNSQLSLRDDSNSKTGPPNIEKLRQEVLKIRKKILVFKGCQNDDEYIEIKDRLVNIFIDIDNVDISSYPQLRRERNLGIDDVQNCFKLLEEVVNEQKEVDECDERDTVAHVHFAGVKDDEPEDVTTFREIKKETVCDSSGDEAEFFVEDDENQHANSNGEFKKPTVVTSF